MTLRNITTILRASKAWVRPLPQRDIAADDMLDWAEAQVQIAKMTLTIRLGRTWDALKISKQRTSAKRH